MNPKYPVKVESSPILGIELKLARSMKKGINLRDFSDASSRRTALSKKLEINLENIGQFSFKEGQVANKNIENLIGAAQIPMGVAGPITINNEEFFIPLATTEGALVASVSRGCKAITESGGAYVYVEEIGMTRGPIFLTRNLKDSENLKTWIKDNLKELKKVTEQTSKFLKLLKIDVQILGRNVFCRFYFNTADAMGMNMATIATQEATHLIEKETKTKCVSIAGNFDIDKKPAWLNFIEGRSRKVWAEVILKKQIVKDVLKVEPTDLADLIYRKCQLGSNLSGSLGSNAHFANIAAAIFIATGQDPSHVVEASLGITTSEVLKNGDLYVSIYMPSLVIGVVGGGTNLPTQNEALSILDVRDQGGVLKFSRAVAGAVLAGEISLLASQTEGTLAKSHQKLGRGVK